MKITRFEDIESWQLARQLANAIYALFSKAKDFGLRDQLQRAVGSIMHNIAEGFDAGSNREFVKFLWYAKRSCTEVQSQLYLAMDQKYITKEDFQQLYEMTGTTRLKIGAFIRYLNNYEKQQSKH